MTRRATHFHPRGTHYASRVTFTSKRRSKSNTSCQHSSLSFLHIHTPLARALAIDRASMATLKHTEPQKFRGSHCRVSTTSTGPSVCATTTKTTNKELQLLPGGFKLLSGANTRVCVCMCVCRSDNESSQGPCDPSHRKLTVSAAVQAQLDYMTGGGSSPWL